MALKIVHLCDVHTTKGEDVTAEVVHAFIADGKSWTIDLCGPCDVERWAPLVAFIQAFALEGADTGERPSSDVGAVDLAALVSAEVNRPPAKAVPRPARAEPERPARRRRRDLEHFRAAVNARNSVPRVCPVCGDHSANPYQWDRHTSRVHGAAPVDFLGLTCALCGEVADVPQTLGMHGRLAHGAAHTPQLFAMAAEAGDPQGIIARMRERYGVAS